VAAPAPVTIAQDLLKITVFDEPDLTNSYRVDGDGFITFPYISRVAAGGLKLGELQDRIRTLLSAGFIRNPQVRVEIGEFKSQSVLVSGEVRQPGKISMTGSMALLEALAAAGSHLAASSELTVAHQLRKRDPTSSDQLEGSTLGKGTDVSLGRRLSSTPQADLFITARSDGWQLRARAGHPMQRAIAIAGGLSERGSTGDHSDAPCQRERRRQRTLEDKSLNDIMIRNRFFDVRHRRRRAA
jgi:protein involved in polysaccharide export with SLBB domain